MSAITPPKLPKLIVNSSGKYKYVFTYKNRWDKEVKRSTRGKGRYLSRYFKKFNEESFCLLLI